VKHFAIAEPFTLHPSFFELHRAMGVAVPAISSAAMPRISISDAADSVAEQRL
jgi:hypothetical protein